MKFLRLTYIFITALIFLLGLQAIWLFNTYQLEKEKISQTINSTLVEAAKLELSERINYLEAMYKSQGLDSITFASQTFHLDSAYLDYQKVVSMEFLFMQHIVRNEAGLPLDLCYLDSIYTSLLLDKNIHVKHNIVYLDSVNYIIEQTTPEVVSGYKTSLVPIINSRKIQVIADISIPNIFRSMGGLLFLSVAIVCLIIACLVYAARTFFTQQHLNKLRDNFVYALTHDMKTPLGTIHAVLDQSSKGLLDTHPEMKTQFTHIAIEQTLNLQALVNQILTVAYIEQRKLSLHKQPVDLPAIVQSLVDKFSVKHNKIITFSIRYELNNGLLYADPLYLTNAISNLIDNAIKYSDSSVNIDILVAEKGKQVYIHVKDNGFGISEKDQKKIFNRFERGSEIKRKSASGFGIGLNYVKAVVDAHGGGITLSSKEMEGSEFVITLPLNQE